jgi:hypothetical protein
MSGWFHSQVSPSPGHRLAFYHDWSGVRVSPLVMWPDIGPLYQPLSTWRVQNTSGMMTDRGNQSTQRETCPSHTLYPTNFIWTALELNLDLQSEKSAILMLISFLFFFKHKIALFFVSFSRVYLSREAGCEEQRWMELGEDRIHWQGSTI